MISFADIEARAAARKGGKEAMEALLLKPKPPTEVAAMPEDRWLSEMTRAIFQSGFNWDLIDRRWPQFEDAFEQFSVTRWLFMSDDDLDRLLKAPGLVHNAMKLKSVAGNARFLSDIANEAGSAGQWFANWPLERYMELCLVLKTRASRLGGRTGQYVMRRMGMDALILSSSVIKALKDAGVVAGEPSSKKDYAAVQKAIDQWHAESGRGLTQMSQILAWSLP